VPVAIDDLLAIPTAHPAPGTWSPTPVDLLPTPTAPAPGEPPRTLVPAPVPQPQADPVPVPVPVLEAPTAATTDASPGQRDTPAPPVVIGTIAVHVAAPPGAPADPFAGLRRHVDGITAWGRR
jgi:hypothetical protein